MYVDPDMKATVASRQLDDQWAYAEARLMTKHDPEFAAMLQRRAALDSGMTRFAMGFVNVEVQPDEDPMGDHHGRNV